MAAIMKDYIGRPRPDLGKFLARDTREKRPTKEFYKIRDGEMFYDDETNEILAVRRDSDNRLSLVLLKEEEQEPQSLIFELDIRGYDFMDGETVILSSSQKEMSVVFAGKSRINGNSLFRIKTLDSRSAIADFFSGRVKMTSRITGYTLDPNVNPVFIEPPNIPFEENSIERLMK